MEVVGLVLAVASVSSLAGFLLTKRSEGLEVIVEGTNPEVDIVFVHGLGGDRRETWAAQIKSQKVNWMTDLPKNIGCHARILSYGYSTRLFSDAEGGLRGEQTKQTPLGDRVLQYLPQALYLHSDRLLQQMTALRGDAARDRPIVWIGHSLGGLIVKNTLVQASSSIGTHYKQKATQLSTCGVLFFGTPMQDTSSKSWARILTRIMSVSLDLRFKINFKKHDTMFEDFDLQGQRYKGIERQFRNYSFCENKKTTSRSVGGPFYVVPKESLIPDDASGRWVRFDLEAGHCDMVKFQGEGDVDYRKVRRSIVECLESRGEASRRSSEYFRRLASLDRLRDPETVTTLTEESEQSEGIYKDRLRQSERSNEPLFETTVLKDLARSYAEKGGYLKAELLYKRAFVVIADSDRYGPWHPATVSILQSLAEVEIAQEKFAEATENLMHLQTFQKHRHGEDDPKTSGTRAIIAVLYDKQKRWHDAEEMYKRTIQAREKRSEDLSEETLSVMENLALSYRLRGKKTWRRAAEQYEKVLDLRLKNLKNPSSRSLELRASQDGPQSEKGKEIQREDRAQYTALRTTVFKLAEVYEVLGDTKCRQKLLHDYSHYVKQG